LPIKLDLIDVNDPSGRFRPPSGAELDAFRDALRVKLGMPVAGVTVVARISTAHAACWRAAGRKTGQQMRFRIYGFPAPGKTPRAFTFAPSSPCSCLRSLGAAATAA
jgi:hypothetical protein